ncbi:tetratricopeptide repeat protein, partial [Candidatus Peregrinibacteria bacterium]|nr:tetratricopeptide repeat protein [Candidatus Peregrinibacteria bacterium]
GRYEDALKLYKRVLMLKPDNYLAWNNQGNVLKELRRHDEAIDSFERALMLSPDSPITYYNMATIYAKLHRKDKMLTSLSKAFQLNGMDYKDDALNDPSFKEYWNDSAFKNLTEA